MSIRISAAILFVGFLGCSGSKPESASLGKAINDATKENVKLMSEIEQLKNQIGELKRAQSVVMEEKEQLRTKLDNSTRKIEEADRKAKLAAERNAELLKQTEILA